MKSPPPLIKERGIEGVRGGRSKMNIRLNGKTENFNGTTSLEDLIKIYLNGKEAKGIAIALNSAIVPRQKWIDTVLNENDEVEVVHAVQGG